MFGSRSSFLSTPILPTLLALGSCALISCAEDATQPDTATNQSAGTPELAVTTYTWLKRADMPGEARFGFAMANVTNAAGESVLYVIGGCTIRGGTSGLPSSNSIWEGSRTSSASAGH
jgi:hypothetical protein